MPNVLVFFSERRCAVLFFREISCVQHQNRLNTFVSSEEQKPLPQPTSEKPVACHACNDDDCSKNRKCYEENTGNHLAPLSHSQRLLLERFHIVLMMPMVVMVDVFVIVMSDGSFSIYVHWLNIFFWPSIVSDKVTLREIIVVIIVRAACGAIRPSMLALRFRVWKHIYTVAKVMNNSDINRWRVFINVFYISVIPLRYVSMPLGNTAWKPPGGQSSWQWCGINFLNLSFRISAKVINFASVAPFSPYCRNNLLEFGAEH